MRITTRLTACVLFLLAAAFFASAGQPAQKAHEVPEVVTKALLSGDWQKAANLCEKSGDLAASPVLRAVNGHACLALNRNDESLGMFLSLKSEADRETWRRWTNDFAKKNPSNHVALYLKGDALARHGQWEPAVDAYSAALRIEPDFAMALNARGVAYAGLGEDTLALEDLEAACAAAPGFADAHASLATFLVDAEAPEGALRSYERALKASSAFALANNGRGCARIGYSGDSASVAASLADFVSAAKCASVQKLAESNIRSIMEIAGRSTGTDSIGTQEGMSLRTRDMLHMNSDIQQGYFDRMSDHDLLSAYDKFGRNAVHSERWSGIFGGLSGQVLGSGLDLSGLSQTSMNDGRGWRDLQTMAFSELKMRGLDPTAGGASTRGIEKEYADTGDWPVETWFGLAQQVELPPRIQTEKEKAGETK